MVGYCIELHVRRRGNMFYIIDEMIILFLYLLIVYTALIYLVVKLSYGLT